MGCIPFPPTPFTRSFLTFIACFVERWAAKEAIIKAYSPYRRLYMRDIEIWTQSTSTRPNNSAPVTTDAIAARDMPDTGQTGADTLSDLTGQEPSPQPYGIVLDRPRKEDDGPDRLRAEEIYSRWKATKPRILDAEGTLDLNAVCEALSSETPSRPAPSSPTGASASASASASSQQDAPTHSTSTILRDLAHRDRDINDTEGQTVRISISHDGEYCIATALAALPSSPTTHPPRSTRPSLTLFSPTILPPSTPKQTKRAAVTTTNSPTSTDVPRTHPPIATDSATGAAEAEAIVPRRLLSRVPAQASGDGAKRRLGFRPQSPASTTSSPLPGSSSSSSSSPADDIVAGLVDRLWRKKP